MSTIKKSASKSAKKETLDKVMERQNEKKNPKAKGKRQKAKIQAKLPRQLSTVNAEHRTQNFLPTVKIEIINRQRLFSINRAEAALLAASVLHSLNRADVSLTITFIRDRLMQRLNREYRQMDQPTDVLSFVYDVYDEAEKGGFSADARNLGDVIISVETAARYATKLGLTFEQEIRNLIIHGTLHLAGYDHETDDGEMNRLERRLRRELNQ
jgi:probable rRNA maturation factor